MRTVKRSALVPYSAAQMYAIVDDVEAYPQFLRWCRSAKLHSRDESRAVASLELQRGGVSKTFKTSNALRPDEAIELKLLDGPFRHLSGVWTFKALGDQGCKVEFNLDFEFENNVTDLLLGPFFEDTCNSLVDEFTSRAVAVYGGGHE